MQTKNSEQDYFFMKISYRNCADKGLCFGQKAFLGDLNSVAVYTEQFFCRKIARTFSRLRFVCHQRIRSKLARCVGQTECFLNISSTSTSEHFILVMTKKYKTLQVFFLHSGRAAEKPGFIKNNEGAFRMSDILKL